MTCCSCWTLFVPACLCAADPTFLRRSVSAIQPHADDLTAGATGAFYRPIFGVGRPGRPPAERNRALRRTHGRAARLERDRQLPRRGADLLHPLRRRRAACMPARRSP